MGALFADINVHEGSEVRITFDEDLWPERKEPVSALAVATLLGIRVEQEMYFRELPFAWPGLGEHTFSTVEYTEMMLKAYASQRADNSVELPTTRKLKAVGNASAAFVLKQQFFDQSDEFSSRVGL
ncbi:hypothetical protein [Halocynthiibacter styelae]|uniref:Uncharacterized protein n=1 Tax=Halocynthiibacter styelae TaxID=2761955 RepID=A0A8J7IW25_9RHOB|nr:hypothetical protein [Paenihalocynthiibacter styelae]MBI1492790.1 hypothetical protein [Paenihalocynthiibacter styelae]